MQSLYVTEMYSLFRLIIYYLYSFQGWTVIIKESRNTSIAHGHSLSSLRLDIIFVLETSYTLEFGNQRVVEPEATELAVIPVVP